MLAAVQPWRRRGARSIELIDVDADPALERAFGERVPVLFAGNPATGVELCHYRLDRARVEAALAGAGVPPP